MMYVPVESKQKGAPYHHKTLIHGFTQKWQDFTINLRNSWGERTHSLTHVMSCCLKLVMSVLWGMRLQPPLSLCSHHGVAVQQTCGILPVSWHRIKPVTLITGSKGFLTVSRTSWMPAGGERWKLTHENSCIHLCQKFSLLQPSQQQAAEY